MIEELKLCPYCGGSAVLVDKFKDMAYFVECTNEACFASVRADTEAEVVQKWNRRSTEKALRQAARDVSRLEGEG
jgi:Lar family restriction alleviation protein